MLIIANKTEMLMFKYYVGTFMIVLMVVRLDFNWCLLGLSLSLL